VLDLMLPKVDGLAVPRDPSRPAQRRRADPRLTAKRDESDKVLGLRAAPTTI
jgi:DNA-binding response OmpR family regulator